MKLEPESTHASCIMQVIIVQRSRYNSWKHPADTGQKQYVPWYLISKTCTWLRILHYAVAILLYSARLWKFLAMQVCSYISWWSASHRYTCICLRKLNFKQYNTLDYIPWWFLKPLDHIHKQVYMYIYEIFNRNWTTYTGIWGSYVYLQKFCRC